MKKVFLLILVLCTLLVFFASAETGVPEEDKTIWCFSVSRSGEIASGAYVLQLEGDEYVLGMDEREGKTVRQEYVDVLSDLLVKHDIFSWDGFAGEPPEGVEILDGESFMLSVELMDGTYIYATGDNVFPENYGLAMDDVWRVFTWMAEDENLP